MKEKRFRALVEDEKGIRHWEYYGTFQEPAWMDSVKIIVKDSQFTGMILDEGLTPVFEGDILRCSYTHFETKEERTYTGKMFWNERNLAYELDFIEHNEDTNKELVNYVGEIINKVIGNIYENPELLKGATDSLS